MIDHPENEERIHHEIRSLRARIAELEGALNPSGPGREPDRRGDEYFHRFFQAIPHPIYVVDVSTHSIVLANAAADRSDEAAVGTCHKLIHRNEAPCSDGEAFCPLEEVRRTGRAAMVEHVHYDGQGRQRYVEINAFPVFDEAGRLVQMIEWCRDTTRERAAQKEQADRRDRLEEQVRERTEALEASNRDLRAEIEERKRIEERLRQSELWMRSTFDSLDDAALIVTPDRRLAGINQAAHDMFGYTFEELSLHSTSLLHVGEAHFQEFGRRIQEAFGQGRTARFEFEARRRNGEVFPTEHTVTLLKDRQGEAIGILSVVRDITERKRNEEILQKSQASLARAQEIAHLGNWDWDLGSGALTWSDEIYRIFGLQPGAFGATYEEFVAAIHPDDRDDLQRAVDEAVYQGRVYSVEHRVVRPDGTVRVVREIGEVTRDSAGRPVHMLGTVQDITEIKQAEDELARYREHLEELIRERTSELEQINERLSEEIEERARAEGALRESEAHLRTLMEQAPVGILTIDNQGFVTDANPASLELLGSPRLESTTGLNVLTLPTLVQSGLSRYFQEVLEKGEPREVEAPYTSIWGKQSLLRTRLVPRYNSQGEQVGAIQILEDITARRDAETELRKLYQAVEYSPSTVVITNLDGNIEYVNPRFSETTGYAREEVIGRNPRILKSGGQGPEVYRDLWETITSGGKWRGELLNRRKNEELYWEMASISAVKDDQGRVTHYVAVKEDITNRKQAEEALQRELEISSATARLAETLIAHETSMPEVTRRILGEACRLTSSRHGFISEIDPVDGANIRHEYSGFEQEACPLAGRHRKSDRPQEFGGYIGLWGHALNNRQGYYTNTPAAHPSWSGLAPPGHIELERFLSVPSRVEGQLVGQIALANPERDYSDRDLEAVQRLADIYALAIQRSRNAEALREAKVSAELASRAKSEFLANMSHEIRTPMNAIMGMIDLTLMEELGSEQRDNLITARDSSQHLLSIINDILDLSKIESGRVELERVDFDLAEVVDSARRFFAEPAARHGIDLKTELAPDLDRHVKGDPHRLRQVLVNLIGNAFKFTESGSITVSVRRTPSGGESTAGPWLLFCVKDTGIGIPEAKREVIFESFTQAESYTTRKYGGTGLGLAISRRLIEMMDGRIWVESEVGRGSEFRFTVRLEPGEAPAARAGEAANETVSEDAGRPMFVLVAEDNIINAKVASRFLSRLGHRSMIAADGIAALGLLARHPFDIVLMDVEMPEMDGFEATRRIRAGEAGAANRGIPVIAMTAHVLQEFKEMAERAGMDDFLSKPVHFYELNTLLDRYVPQRTAGRAMDSGREPLAASRAPLDRQDALRRIGGDEALLEELYDIMAGDIPAKKAALREAMDPVDPAGLERVAHSLKGACLSVGARDCYKAAFALEQTIKAAPAEGVGLYVERLVEALENLEAALAARHVN